MFIDHYLPKIKEYLLIPFIVRSAQLSIKSVNQLFAGKMRKLLGKGGSEFENPAQFNL